MYDDRQSRVGDDLASETACVAYVFLIQRISIDVFFQGQSRDVEVSTSKNNGASAVILDGDEDNSNTGRSSRKLTYLPSCSRSYSLWYKHRWVTICRRSQDQISTIYNNKTKEQYLQLRYLIWSWLYRIIIILFFSILTWSNRFLIELLREARQEYIAGQEHSVCIYTSDTMWVAVSSFPCPHICNDGLIT